MTDLRDQLATADHLAEIAVQLAVRVRDETPEDNGRWLAEQLPDPADWFRLSFVLAAAVPDDRSWTALTAWTVTREPTELIDTEGSVRRRRKLSNVQPCGTHAAATRHRYHGEALCAACVEAERTRDRDRKRLRRAA